MKLTMLDNISELMNLDYVIEYFVVVSNTPHRVYEETYYANVSHINRNLKFRWKTDYVCSIDV